jgi:cytochrome c-type protein NapB
MELRPVMWQVQRNLNNKSDSVLFGLKEAVMKKAMMMIVAGAVVMLQAPLAVSDEVASLRGDNSLDAEAKMFDKTKQIIQQGGFKRSWSLQPPPIPHEIDKDRISLQENTCIRCHSKENHEKEKAPEIGQSHYLDRDGKVLDKLSTRRWFCMQCHTPQADVPALVENTF